MTARTPSCPLPHPSFPQFHEGFFFFLFNPSQKNGRGYKQRSKIGGREATWIPIGDPRLSFLLFCVFLWIIIIIPLLPPPPPYFLIILFLRLSFDRSNVSPATCLCDVIDISGPMVRHSRKTELEETSYRRRTLQRVHTPVSIDQSGSEGAAAATHKKGGVEDPGLFSFFFPPHCPVSPFSFCPFPGISYTYCCSANLVCMPSVSYYTANSPVCGLLSFCGASADDWWPTELDRNTWNWLY